MGASEKLNFIRVQSGMVWLFRENWRFLLLVVIAVRTLGVLIPYLFYSAVWTSSPLVPFVVSLVSSAVAMVMVPSLVIRVMTQGAILDQFRSPRLSRHIISAVRFCVVWMLTLGALSALVFGLVSFGPVSDPAALALIGFVVSLLAMSLFFPALVCVCEEGLDFIAIPRRALFLTRSVRVRLALVLFVGLAILAGMVLLLNFPIWFGLFDKMPDSDLLFLATGILVDVPPSCFFAVFAAAVYLELRHVKGETLNGQTNVADVFS